MDLKNPVFRQLLRFVVASVYEGLRKAWEGIIKNFGINKDKAIEVGKFIWEHKDNNEFKELGFEEITKDEAAKILEKLYEGKEDIYLGLINIKPLQKVLYNYLVNTYHKYVSTWNIQSFHKFMNELYKSKLYLEIVNNPEAQKRLLPNYLEYKKSASLRVMLRYLDTLENQ